LTTSLEEEGRVKKGRDQDIRCFMTEPVFQVERKIKRKGSHVPKKLSNILALLSITAATMKTSINMTNATKIIAVSRGVVKLNFLK